MGSGVQFFPQTIPASTLLGRLASGAGPVEAIPFAAISAALSNIINANATFSINGGGAVDDTTAVQNAFNSAPSGSALVISGTPLISSKITLNRNLMLIFPGKSGVTTTDLPGSYFIKKSTMTTQLLDITINGAVIIGGGILGQAGNTGDGIDVLANNVVLSQFAVFLCGQDGIRIGSNTGVNANSFALYKCVSANNGRRGFFVDDASNNANAGSMTACFAQNNTEDGFRFTRAAGNTITGCLSEQNTGWGIHFASGSSINSVFGGDFQETNIAGQTLIDSGANDTYIIGAATGAVSDSGTRTVLMTDQAKLIVPKIFSNATGTAPAATTTGVQLGRGGFSDTIFVDSAQSANNRIAEFIWTSGLFIGRMCSDDFSLTPRWITVTGSQSAGLVSAAWGALRVEEAQGAVVSSANNLVLGNDGNYFQISGATQINLLSNIGYQGGSCVTLKFNSTPTVKHNQATSSTNVKIILNGAIDFVAAANNTLTLRYDATDIAWYEQSRKV